jgi:hypothetical protein
MAELTRVMREACGSKLVAVTCGEDSSILATENLVSFLEKLLKTCEDSAQCFVCSQPVSFINIVRDLKGLKILRTGSIQSCFTSKIL